MSNLKMTRTIWPVGQGAFYTECFQNGNNHFNVVYDCGSYIYGIDDWRTPSNLSSQINEANLDKVDLLFVSHFHWDHINGIQHLMHQAKNAKTRLIMPNMSDTVKSYYFLSILIDSGLGDEIIASSNNQQNGVQSVPAQTANFYRNLIWNNYDNVTSVEESTYIRLRFDSENDNVTIDTNSGAITEDEIERTNRSSNKIWVYCLKVFGKQDLEEGASAMIEIINALSSNLVNDLRNGEYGLLTTNVWEKVKKAYDKDKPNRSKANNNSLIVLSMPLFIPKHKSYIEKSDTPCCSFGCCHRMYDECLKIVNPSALYTGDMEKVIDFELLLYPIRHCRHYHHLGLYQISHHGHNNEFNQREDHRFHFYLNLAFCCYGSENNYHHPDYKLLKSYCKRDICTIGIDEYSDPLIHNIDLE